MKKLILMAALGISLCANAQLTVFDNGKVHVGNNPLTVSSATATLNICDVTSASPETSLKSCGSISFGGGSGATISGNSRLGFLGLQAASILQFGLGQQTSILSLSSINSSFTSLYNMRAPAFLTTSDARLKTNVESLREIFSKLQDVNSVSYNLSSSQASVVSAMTSDETKVTESTEDDRTHFGFIAQEIQEIFPNLVVEDEDGMLAIDYTGFIPLLVEAYNDLSKKVKGQEEVIDALLAQKGPSYMPASVNGIADSKASLKQNKPNPFNTTTTIECSVPQSVASAFICVYDLQGKQVHRIDIRERGDVVNVIDASYFTPGMYIYTLIADGVEIDSKRMIITD